MAFIALSVIPAVSQVMLMQKIGQVPSGYRTIEFLVKHLRHFSMAAPCDIVFNKPFFFRRIPVANLAQSQPLHFTRNLTGAERKAETLVKEPPRLRVAPAICPAFEKRRLF
ncbi:MAG: hypothetical protein LBU19_03930 [Treponema sp.]|nr:hypothetical protein [Treponema sp.]